jgi:hypothetical protein
MAIANNWTMGLDRIINLANELDLVVTRFQFNCNSDFLTFRRASICGSNPGQGVAARRRVNSDRSSDTNLGGIAPLFPKIALPARIAVLI